MATEKQIQANRANAQKSTGPVTAAGKRISSRNSSRYLPARAVVVPGESVRAFNDLAASLTREFQPRTSTEASLVQTMAAARWRMLRMWGIQSAGLALEMDYLDSSVIPGAPLATAFRRLAFDNQCVAHQHRLEAAYDRQYNKALEMLLKLREKPPIEATPEPPPPPTST